MPCKTIVKTMKAVNAPQLRKQITFYSEKYAGKFKIKSLRRLKIKPVEGRYTYKVTLSPLKKRGK